MLHRLTGWGGRSGRKGRIGAGKVDGCPGIRAVTNRTVRQTSRRNADRQWRKALVKQSPSVVNSGQHCKAAVPSCNDVRCGMRWQHDAVAVKNEPLSGRSAGPSTGSVRPGRQRPAVGTQLESLPGSSRPRGRASQPPVRRLTRVAVDAGLVRRTVQRARPILRREVVPDRDPRMVPAVLPVRARRRLLAGARRVLGRRPGDPHGRLDRSARRARRERATARRAPAPGRVQRKHQRGRWFRRRTSTKGRLRARRSRKLDGIGGFRDYRQNRSTRSDQFLRCTKKKKKKENSMIKILIWRSLRDSIILKHLLVVVKIKSRYIAKHLELMFATS